MGLELDKQIVWSTLKDLGAWKKKVSLRKLYEKLLNFEPREIDVIVEDLLIEEVLQKPTEETIKLVY